MFALSVERKINHHDGILLHDTDQQDDPNQSYHVELVLRNQQSEQRTNAGGRKRGQDRNRVREALVKNAQHDIDGQQRSQDQQRFAGQRVLERSGRALKTSVDGGRKTDAALGVVNHLGRIAERNPRG